MEEAIKSALSSGGTIPDSLAFAEKHGFAHADLIGVCKSLKSGEFIATKDLSKMVLQLTKEGAEAEQLGSPEARLFALVPADGIMQAELEKAAGAALFKVGMAKAQAGKLVKTEKVGEDTVGADGKKVKAPQRVLRAAQAAQDSVQQQLKAVLAAGGAEDALAKADFELLKKRGLVAKKEVKSLEVCAGAKFDSWGRKAVTDLTHEMIVKGSWRDADFKPLNFSAAGKPPTGGALHPLMKVRSMFREIFLEMGFEEMQTNKYVESSFWNFDALFQPQQHPARDAHDTFFARSPRHPQIPRTTSSASSGRERWRGPPDEFAPSRAAGGTTGRRRRAARTCCARTRPPHRRARSTRLRRRCAPAASSSRKSTFRSTASSATRRSTRRTSPSSTRSRASSSTATCHSAT